MATPDSSTSAVKSSMEPKLSSKSDDLAVVSTASTTSNGPSFEALPAEIRLNIYRLLLVCKELIEPHSFYFPLFHPAILYCNKRIHDEATSVLYGENCFRFCLGGRDYTRLWHRFHAIHQEERPLASEKYTRKMTKVYIDIDIRWNALYHSQNLLGKSLQFAAMSLVNNNLRLLKIGYQGCGTSQPYRSQGDQDQTFLEPLLKIRATRLEIQGNDINPLLAARLKATIEGPMDAAFLEARRLAYEGDKDYEDDEDSVVGNMRESESGGITG